MQKPLFSSVRSHETIKEDQMRVLSSIAEKHVGRVRKSRFIADTMPDPLQRSFTSFRGKRDVAHRNSNSIAQAVYLYIDESLGRIFPPLLDREFVNTERCIDNRLSVATLPYRAHTRTSFEAEMEKAEQRSSAFSATRSSSTSFPKSPFGEASPSHPAAHVFHPPIGLEVVLERIERRELLRGPWVDPATELVSRADPPLPSDAREELAISNMRSLLRAKRRVGRRLKPLSAQDGALDTSAQTLHRRMAQQRTSAQAKHVWADAPLVSVVEPAAFVRQPSVARHSANPAKSQSVSFGDMLVHQ
jgi:hypothetical protein